MAAKAKPKPKSKTKPKAKAAPKKAAPKKTAKAKPTSDTGRHRGRRPEPQPKVKAKHTKEMSKLNDHLVKMEQKQIEDRRRNEDNVQAAKDELAVAIDAAQKDGYSTKEIGELIDKSRQTVFKLVAERVDGKTLNKPKPSKKGKDLLKDAKQIVLKDDKKPKGKTKAKAKAKPKATAKKKPVVTGRKADPASMGKAKPKPKPKVRPRPRTKS